MLQGLKIETPERVSTRDAGADEIRLLPKGLEYEEHASTYERRDPRVS